MVTWYWVTEYMKVLAGYVFIMFIWPSVVLRKYLRGRSTTFWFGFCVTFQPVLFNTVVLFLGLFHLLNVWVVRGLFYIPFGIEVLKWLSWGRKETKNVKHLLNGTYGIKLFCHNVVSGVRKRLSSIWTMLRAHLGGHWLECGVLAVILIYGMLYFSWGSFQDYTYGASDMYVHNSWIYGLLQGQVFSAGVYPEGMHCFIYGIHVLFGIRIYSCFLFLQGIHVAVFLLSVYVLLKEVFHWRYTAMFVLTAFLVLEIKQMDAIIVMSRLQWTLPQEFALPSIFLCAAFLVRYMRSKKRRAFRGKLTKGYWDENLLVFVLALASTLIIHFYPTIMAFFLCLCFVPANLSRVFDRKRFVPLVIGVLAGVFLAVVPMAAARATGIPFEGSINWAMSVMGVSRDETEEEEQTEGASQAGTSPAEDAGQAGTSPGEEAGQEGTSSAEETGQAGMSPAGGSGQAASPAGEAGQGTAASGTAVFGSGSGSESGGAAGSYAEPPRESLGVRVAGMCRRIRTTLAEKGRLLYLSGYRMLYREEGAPWVMGITILALLIWLCYRVIAGFLWLLLRKRERKPKPGYFDQYLGITLSSIMFMILFRAPVLGLPTLIEVTRLCYLVQLLVLAALGVPIDLIFTTLRLMIHEGVMKAVSAVAVAGIYVFALLTGNYHGYLNSVMTRLNGAVMCTYSITETMPKYSYTVVSPTDELYQMIQYGWHEELITFANKVQGFEYRLPSEYVFIYIEKTPIHYAQYHFYEGPGWLAETGKYSSVFGSSYSCQSPDIMTGKLNPEELAEGSKFFNSQSSTYGMLITRSQVESVAYLWCQEFQRMYPGELKVYYEDDNFICYYFKQNPQSLYQLGLLY